MFVFVLLFTKVCAQENSGAPSDQFLVVFGSSGYVLYKVMDFANDHGFRYIKILSYEFSAFDHKMEGRITAEPCHGGRYFELRDENAMVAFLCYDIKPKDPMIIDLLEYRDLLGDILN